MRAGEASMLSIVPRSHSRDTIRAVSRVPVIVITIAMIPGTMKSAERSSGLNQSRYCSSMPPAGALRRSVTWPASQTCSAPET